MNSATMLASSVLLDAALTSRRSRATVPSLRFRGSDSVLVLLERDRDVLIYVSVCVNQMLS